MITMIFSIFFLIQSFTPSYAGKNDPHAPVKMPKNFELLKALEGKWEGSVEGDVKKELFQVTYEPTSGGSALVEKLFVGAPHEMVSIYHAQNGKVAMTHYCMEGNHPKLYFKKGDAKSLEFEMKDAEGLTSKNENHMHALKISWLDHNHIKQEWTSFENGKKKETAVFNLTRKTN